MGFWPFGRDPANIEIVSRVVTATAKNGYRVRAKLTLHFLEPQRQADADEAADRCAAIATAILREAPDHSSLIGSEARLGAELTSRYPAELPKVRAVELASVHVVGDPGLSDEIRRSLKSQPPGPITSPTPYPGPVASGPVHPANLSPFPGATPGAPPVRRRGSSQIRSIQTLLMPPGTPPVVMGQFVAPTVKDSAARLLVGYLRAHDLLTVRRAPVDENSAETLATLVPASDAPPGGYEASRASELARWQGTLGEAPLHALHREARVRTVHLMRQALQLVELNPTQAEAVIDGVCGAAFADETGLDAEVARLAAPTPQEFVGDTARAFAAAARANDDPLALAAALAPLMATLEEDLKVSAMIIKASSGT